MLKCRLSLNLTLAQQCSENDWWSVLAQCSTGDCVSGVALICFKIYNYIDTYWSCRRHLHSPKYMSVLWELICLMKLHCQILQGLTSICQSFVMMPDMSSQLQSITVTETHTIFCHTVFCILKCQIRAAGPTFVVLQCQNKGYSIRRQHTYSNLKKTKLVAPGCTVVRMASNNNLPCVFVAVDCICTRHLGAASR